MRDDRLIITAASSVRSGWAEAFAQLANSEDEDVFLDDFIATSWDEQEWEW